MGRRYTRIVRRKVSPMQPKSRPFRRISCLLLLTALVGCSSSTPPVQTPSFPFSDVTLRVACPNATVAAVVQAASRPWVSRQKAREVNVVHYDPGAGPQTIPDADLWVLPASELPRWVSDGKLLPVPDTYLQRDHP